MSNKFDDFSNTVSKLLNEMKELREENHEITDINKNLSKKVNQLKLKIDGLEQKSLKKMREISKILVSGNEDYVSIFKKLGINNLLSSFKLQNLSLKNN